MAELLLKRALTGTGPGAYQAGDVVDVREDGAYWAPSELDDTPFLLVRVAGAPVSDYAALLEPVETTDPETGAPVLTKIRARGLDLSRLPTARSIEAVLAHALSDATVAR